MVKVNQEKPESESQSESSPLHEFVDHQRKAADEAMKAMGALLPPEFRTHGKTAREEFLLSFKVLIEGAASAVDRELNRTQAHKGSDSGSGPSTTGKSKVKVEVS